MSMGKMWPWGSPHREGGGRLGMRRGYAAINRGEDRPRASVPVALPALLVVQITALHTVSSAEEPAL